jgi:hypothetical protein
VGSGWRALQLMRDVVRPLNWGLHVILRTADRPAPIALLTLAAALCVQGCRASDRRGERSSAEARPSTIDDTEREIWPQEYTDRRLAAFAREIQQYRGAQGHYPSSLQKLIEWRPELCSGVLEKGELCVQDGWYRPFRYRVTADGAEIASGRSIRRLRYPR